MKQFKLYEILPGKLYQRGNFRKLSLLEKDETLKAHHIDVIVSLAGKFDQDLKKLDEMYHIKYYYYHMTDGKNFSDDVKSDLLRIAKNVADDIRSGKSVIVHCKRGRNRSGLLNALIVREIKGISGEAALNWIWEHRPNSISNQLFQNFLKSLD